VIRAGKTVGEVDDPSSVTAEQLAEMMVGSELPSPETRESTVTERVLLEVRDLAVEPGARLGEVTLGITTSADLFTGAPGPVASHRPLDGVSIQVHAGEIVGIAGVEGNGQAELIDSIVGLVSATGTVSLDGTDISKLSTLARRSAGIGLIPEDRHRDGMVLAMPLWENVLLGHQSSREFSERGLIDRDACRRRAEEVVRGFDVRTPSIDVRGFTLSGGNQQKLIVGREMLAKPRVLIAAHPTRGVDVGAQAAIWDILREARAAGLATLLISADLEELIGLSDRLLVMLRGKIVADLDPATVSQADLGGYMTGALTQQGRNGPESLS
jgi:general nucleoside transport system ATP-binding protein